MKSINTLIKIHTRELDEFRKSIVSCEEEKDRLIIYNNKLEDDLLRERDLAIKDVEMGRMFANYKKMIQQKQEVIVKTINVIDKKISVLKENIAIKFNEVKRYEILLQQKILAEQKAESARETKQLDEIASQKYFQEAD